MSIQPTGTLTLARWLLDYSNTNLFSNLTVIEEGWDQFRFLKLPNNVTSTIIVWSIHHKMCQTWKSNRFSLSFLWRLCVISHYFKYCCCQIWHTVANFKCLLVTYPLYCFILVINWLSVFTYKTFFCICPS